MRRQSLKHAMETVRREMEESPPWLKEIYARNREIRRRAMQQRGRFHETQAVFVEALDRELKEETP